MTKKNNRILIIEDDDGLAQRLGNALKGEKNLGFSPKIIFAHSKEEAESLFPKNLAQLNCVILDTMLPNTQEAYDQMRIMKQDLDNIRSQMEILKNVNEKRKLSFKRQTILGQINKGINRLAGIELAETMMEIQREQGFNHTTPLIFLTAVGDEDAQKKGKDIYPNSVWIVKPIIRINEIIEPLKGLNHKENAS
jgi:CheY-like chemotaxis protein